jgi:hypothetical protein
MSCLFGIALMVRMMRKHGMFSTGVPKMLMRISPGRFSTQFHKYDTYKNLTAEHAENAEKL